MIKRRNTKQRRLTLTAVQNNCNHPSAEQIYQDVLKMDKGISRSTVYRNLKLLSDEGLITKVEVPGADRYDFNTKPHFHLICGVCGCVCDAILEYDEDLDRQVEENSGFEVNQHTTIFQGICPDCLARKDEKK